MARNPVQFWFNLAGDYRQLPVNPEAVSIESPFQVNTINLTNIGEVAILGERGLKRITFSSFFPHAYNPSYCDTRKIESPWDWIERIEKWRDKRVSVRFSMTATQISIPVFIEEFTIEPERAGSPGDVYYSITLVEHRVFGQRKKPATTTAVAQPVAQTPRPASNPQPKTYTVVKGDSLSHIAKKMYGKANDWRRIYDANKKVIGKDPNKIQIGQKLVIP